MMKLRMIGLVTALWMPALANAQELTIKQAALDIRALFLIGSDDDMPELRPNAADVFDAIGDGKIDAQEVLKAIVRDLPVPPGARYDPVCSAQWTKSNRRLFVIYTLGYEASEEQKKTLRNFRRLTDGHRDFETVNENDLVIRAYNSARKYLTQRDVVMLKNYDLVHVHFRRGKLDEGLLKVQANYVYPGEHSKCGSMASGPTFVYTVVQHLSD